MPKRHNYVGRCIYCDSTEQLSREHIIPEGIGGRIVPDGKHEALVLSKASCESCREITRKIEEQVQKKMMGHFRAERGLVRKDRRQGHHRLKFQLPDGSTEIREAEFGSVPAVLMLPMFGEPGLLSGKPIGGPYDMRFWTHAAIMKSVDGIRNFPGVKGPTLAGIGPDVFGQMLAKIALGIAVYQLGIDGFRPLVRDFIRGKKEEFGHWIGGPANLGEEPPANVFHEIHMGRSRFVGEQYITVAIRLFANLGAPRNYVIVGEALRPPR